MMQNYFDSRRCYPPEGWGRRKTSGPTELVKLWLLLTVIKHNKFLVSPINTKVSNSLFIVHRTQQCGAKFSYVTINTATCFNPLGSSSGL